MIRIGRGPDNDLAVADYRVSRQHGTIAVRHGILVYTDLDSTNGSFVNGARVAQIALGPGDLLRVGDTTITIVPAS
jgi:pSer/pThr/pTyr-binding forkhead associated (FHA) protein